MHVHEHTKIFSLEKGIKERLLFYHCGKMLTKTNLGKEEFIYLIGYSPSPPKLRQEGSGPKTPVGRVWTPISGVNTAWMVE